MNFDQASLTFLNYLRQYGMALGYPEDRPHQDAAELPRSSPEIRAQLGGNPGAVAAVQSHSLGPGELERLELSREVRRTYPAAGATDVPPNFMPQVELWLADLPWALMPARADAAGLLRPFIALVVVEQRDGVVFSELRQTSNARIRIESNAARELPPSDELHLWAHVQLWGLPGDGEAAIRSALAERDRHVISRLVCPRRLAPNTKYHACVVPVFESGRLSGLGSDPGDASGLKPAWTNHTEAIELPVFFHWSFATGDKGDLEDLVRRLVPRPASANVGSVALDVTNVASALGVALLEAQGLLSMDGALRVPGQAPVRPTPQALSDALRVAINVPAVRPAGDLSLAPPIYARWHARVGAVPALSNAWLPQLNLLPARRAAAGLGALVVQQNQEALMAAAWDQLGDVEEANRLLRQAQLARGVAQAFQSKLQRLSDLHLVQLSGSAHSRVLMNGGASTVASAIAGSRAHSFLATGAFRRLSRPRGPIAKRFAPATRLATLASGVALAEPRVRIPKAGTPDGAASWHAQPSNQVLPEWLTGRGANTEAVNLLRNQLNALTERPGAEPVALAVDGLAAAVRKAFEPDERIVRPLVDPLRGRLRGRPAMVAPDAIEPVMAYPRINEALAPLLSNEAPDLLLPGVEHIPPETVLMLETNAPFIAAFAAGANHEMCRELLWRGFPTDQRGTPLRRFWKTPDLNPAPPLDVLAPLTSWGANRTLGADIEGGQNGRTVLLIRGELMRRFPNLHVALVRARLVEGQLRPVANPQGGQISEPLFSGAMGSDLRYWGFSVTATAAVGNQTAANPGWFVRLQQLEDEPTFGLDETKQIDVISKWDDLSWQHLPQAISHLSAKLHRPATAEGFGADWGVDSASMAAILFQRPVRLFVHARDLIPRG